VRAHLLDEEREDALGGRGVEVAGRLVGEEEPRPMDERACDRDALQLAAGKRLRQPPLLGKPDLFVVWE